MAAATEFKVQGADKPQPGQNLSPRELAVRRLKAKGFLTPDGQAIPRRQFFISLALGWAAFAGAMGGLASVIGAFMVPRVDFTKIEVFKVGPPGNFPERTVDESFKQSRKVWVVNDGSKIFAINSVCTHLGCTPNWMENERKFKCPCHGSGFYIEGINFEGPAPRPLERYAISLGDDGQIKIDKSRKFQHEKGQWEDPDSYLKFA